MKFLIFACLAVAAVADNAQTRYTTKYDGVNLDQILKSDRLLNNYINCVLDKGKCSPDASELKSILPDALKTECSKCSEKQVQATGKVIQFLIKNKPQHWEELRAKYDPENIYHTKYSAKAKVHGIEV